LFNVWKTIENRLSSADLQPGTRDQPFMLRFQRKSAGARTAPVPTATSTEHVTPQPDSCTRLAGVEHRTATVEQLPDLIDLALHGLARNEQHQFSDDGTHTVTHGTRYY
jgi:hypothetical protein